MRKGTSQGRLYLNDTEVGAVKIRGWQSSWGFGDFHPNDHFAEFAPIFGNWSLLMHADADQARLTPEAAEELRRAEYEIDSLHAKLFLPESKQWRRIGQINIDGGLIEWKEV